MGNQFSTTTLCTSKDSHGYAYWVGIDWQPFFQGSRKNCYFGYLNGHGPRGGEKVVVKCFSDGTSTQDKWKQEILKAKLAQHFADVFSEHVNCPKIKVNHPQVALMDTVSKLNQIYDGRRSRTRSLNKDDWVSIEEHIGGEFQRYPANSPSVMDAFTHFTYQQSGGRAIVSDLQGVAKDDGSFHVTDPVIHSLNGSFGTEDQGVTGINDFFKAHRCNRVCLSFPKMTPLTPPPSFEDVISLSTNTMLFTSSSVIPTAPLYENVFMP